jgi:hypothetical protein
MKEDKKNKIKKNKEKLILFFLNFYKN